MLKSAFIVPNYNKQCLLAHSMRSMIDNEGSVIFVYDDASTDNSVEILNYYENKYPERVFVEYGKENKGIAYAMNRLHEMVIDSKNDIDYVMIQGSDDFSFPHRAQLTSEVFESESTVDVVYGSFHKVDIFFNLLEVKIVPEFSEALKTIHKQHGQSIPHGFMAIRKKCLDVLYDESRKFGIDHSYIICLIDKGYKFRKIKDQYDENGYLISSLGMYVINQGCVSIQHREEIFEQDKKYFSKES